MPRSRITAAVISCPGQLGNETFKALQLNVEGFVSPFVLTLAMRALGYQSLAEHADPSVVFEELATAVNAARIFIECNSAAKPKSAAYSERRWRRSPTDF